MTYPNLPEVKGGTSRRRMAGGRQINRLHGLLVIKIIDSRSALPTYWRTSPPSPSTSKISYELEPNNAGWRIGHHLWGDCAFTRTCLFLTLNWHFTQSRLVLVWQLANSSKLTSEWPRVDRRWTSCLRRLLMMNWSSNQDLSLWYRRMTLINWYIKYYQQGQMLVQNLDRIVSRPSDSPGQILYCIMNCISWCFKKKSSENTSVEHFDVPLKWPPRVMGDMSCLSELW